MFVRLQIVATDPFDVIINTDQITKIEIKKEIAFIHFDEKDYIRVTVDTLNRLNKLLDVVS